MSILCCLLFFLCISMHACNARPLVSIDKNDEKKGMDKLPVPVKAEFTFSNTDQVRASSRSENVSEMTSLANKQKKSKSNEKTKTSGSNQNESLVSVSYQVPRNRNKHAVKHPGLNSDYSPPKTHPPSHN
ncbi:hypothetical protein Ddye_018093 [Dipteronia dyeriana]|uniref:Uncharacterized protein n=1 Tax=Dipteronia dyeriana TaxID=168575 RepID=A0AAD9UAF7_9ROSI|nr:hypothetical protein Ddye_018093 [Dipteronia dyeriana]